MIEQGIQEVTLMGEEMLLYPEKAIFWKEKKALICSDLHLGKVSHFRKEGIGVPSGAEKASLNKLTQLIHKSSPATVLFLGDLFHSHYNINWIKFIDFLDEHPEIEFILVLGNHDILDDDHYRMARMKVVKGPMEVGPFLFTHEPMEQIIEGKYNMCGHIHPAVRLRGKARQSVRLPCFYFGHHTGILPAFGAFTGTATIHPQKEEKVFVIAGRKVIAV